MSCKVQNPICMQSWRQILDLEVLCKSQIQWIILVDWIILFYLLLFPIPYFFSGEIFPIPYSSFGSSLLWHILEFYKNMSCKSPTSSLFAKLETNCESAQNLWHNNGWLKFIKSCLTLHPQTMHSNFSFFLFFWSADKEIQTEIKPYKKGTNITGAIGFDLSIVKYVSVRKFNVVNIDFV